MRRSEIIGRRFHRLLVVAISNRKNAKNSSLWECKCDCGSVHHCDSNALTSGRTQSCGCLAKENAGRRLKSIFTKHGLTNSPEYSVWLNMRRRCSDPKNKRYARYGGRGIKVCDSWASDFGAFYADMGPRPSPKHTIEREDNNRGYEPDNCVWATQDKQANNTVTNVFIERDGVRKTASQWARELGVNPDTVAVRIRKGQSLETLFDRTKIVHSSAKLRPDDVRKIRQDKRNNLQIAREYGVSGQTIGDIKLGKSWRHLK